MTLSASYFYSYLDWSNSSLDWFHLLLLVRLKRVSEKQLIQQIKNLMNMLISLYESFCNTAVRKFLFSHSFQQNRRNTHSRGFPLILGWRDDPTQGRTSYSFLRLFCFSAQLFQIQFFFQT